MRIYISAGKSTARIANSLSKALLGKGFAVVPRVGAGEDVRPPIRDAGAFIVLVGERDERSEWLEREWFEILEQASDRTKNLIPLLVGKAEPPHFLKNWQALRMNSAAAGTQWDKLIETIAGLLEAKEIRLAVPRKADLVARERGEAGELRTSADFGLYQLPVRQRIPAALRLDCRDGTVSDSRIGS